LAASSEKPSIARTFAAASAGAVLAGRPRSFISSVLETVMAAVPAKPATRPFPSAAAMEAGAGMASARLPA
jgi:hypothetical protein